MALSSGRIAIRLYIVLVCLYLLSPFGATFHGTVIPDSHPLAFGLMLVSLLLWLAIRSARKWRGYGTRLETTLPFWAVAIAASILANPETANRSAIALWFILLYAGTGYVLNDLVSNQVEMRQWLADALLSAGGVLVFFSVLQMFLTGRWMQPVSLIGNPNALGTILLVVAPFAFGRAIEARRPALRLWWAAYTFAAIATVALTLSRGAWLGLLAGLATMLVLILRDRDLLSITSLHRRWIAHSLPVRRLTFAGAVTIAAVIAILLGLIVNSFAIHERRAGLRAEIWKSALLQFVEKPLTGQGLFTFGYHYGAHASTPPALPYAHAHNLPFNIAAELGILGILALLYSVICIVGNFRRAWARSQAGDRMLTTCCASALVGFAAHHLFDFTAMMPAVALLGIMLIVMPPAQEFKSGSEQPRPQIIHPTVIIALWMIVLFFGWRSSEVNRRYLQSLRLSNYGLPGRTTEAELADYRNALRLLDEVVASEPAMPVYLQQQALLWGLLAARGDAQALEKAIVSFEQFLELEPNDAVSWANLAALYWQSGNGAKVFPALQRAIDLAPESYVFAYNLAKYSGMFASDGIELPHSSHNQEFTRFQFFRESLPLTFLPQLGWGNR